MTPEVAALLPPLSSERRAALWFPFVLPGLNELVDARGKFSGDARRPRRTLYDDIKEREQANLVLFATRQRRAFKLAADFSGRLLIACNWREPNRHRDPDNIVGGGKKLLLDALGPGRAGARGWAGAGVLHCDGQHCIAGFVDVVSCDPAHPGVAVFIAGIEGPADWAPRLPVDLR